MSSVQVDFCVDDDFSLLYALRTDRWRNDADPDHIQTLTELQNHLWHTSHAAFQLLGGRPAYQLLLTPGLRLEAVIQSLGDALSALRTTIPFRDFLTQCEERLLFCRQQWEANLSRSLAAMSDITGLDFSGQVFRVHVVHPACRGGLYIEDGHILWGGAERFANYSTVYIWHEMLHSYLDESELSHALIELACDCELNRRLNGESYPPWIGHSSLHLLKEKLLPYWQGYLQQPSRELIRFRASLPDLTDFAEQG